MRRSNGLATVAAVLGVAVPSLGVVVLPIWQFPGTSASGAAIVRFVSEHRSAVQVVMITNAVGVCLWLVFGAALWARLRAGHRESTLPTVFGAGLVGFVTLLLAGFVAFDVLVYRPPGAADARLLYDLTFGLLAMSGLPTAIALGSYALLVRRDRTLPASTGHLATIAAAAHVALLASFIVPRGFFSLEGQVITVVPGLLWAWILVTGIALARRAAPSR